LRALDGVSKGFATSDGDDGGFRLQPALCATYNRLLNMTSFDICIIHSQLPDVIELVRQCPNTRFVLDHVGKPVIRQHARSPGERRKNLPACHVACKISGMVTEATTK